MLSIALLATSCLDIFGSTHSAYSARLDDKIWKYVLSDPADVDDVEAMFRPLREYDDQLHGLREKMGAYAGERLRLQSERARLAGKREGYEPLSAKNRAVTEELRVVEARLATVDAAWTEMVRVEERLEGDRRRELASVRVRLGVLVERALRR